MKIRISYGLFFGIVIILSCKPSKQHKAEILLVGVFHHIPDSIAGCNWQPTLEMLLNYKPDQIAVEEVAPGDSSSLVHSLGDDYRQYFDSLLLEFVGTNINVSDSIKLYKELLEKEENFAFRLLLWKYYHLGLDMGNRDFQSFRIMQNIIEYSSLIDTLKSWDKFFWTKYQRFVTNRKNSEFYNIIYPLAISMKINYLYPTDDKITYPLQSEAYGGFSEQLANTKYMNRMDSFWIDFNKTESHHLKNCNGLFHVNELGWLDKTDYGQAHILDDADNAAYQEFATVWYRRNKSIANRIIQASIESKAKKMVVFYGYMHIYPVRKFLEQAGYTVKLLGDLN